MEMKSKANKVHCMVLSYPAQGHTNPMLQFSKRLQHEGLRVTFVSTIFYCNNNMQKLPLGISLKTISDGYDSGRIGEAKRLRVYLDGFRKVGPKTLVELLEKLHGSEHPVDCLVYDSFMPWALDVAKRFGIVGVPFLTQNMAVNSVYYHVHLGKLQAPLMDQEISLPSLPKLKLGDMPSFFFNYVEDSVFLDLLVADWTMKMWPKFRTVGPSIFLLKQTKDDEDCGVAQFTSEECMKWLDNKPKGFVVYVSFGSMATLSEEQMEELGYGLSDSGRY
ncbi:hypothetical protein VNO78_16131 [Psophocarpus tetragonolobus]|uniref:Uncharacterized protein n=1 Tax=Psophocarpus tetragonolobus TaxID=3891 RepID=A0AAN9SHA9_PSOTE